jgi:c-di-GMP-binding flagellar brake protein YcgR
MLTRERRNYERFDLSLPATIEFLESARRNTISLTTGNISAGGIFFRTVSSIAEGTKVRLNLTVTSKYLEEQTGAQGLIRVQGRVVRSNSVGTAISFAQDYQITRKDDNSRQL